MTDYKVGDKVICVGASKSDNITGFGWAKDYVFTIQRITIVDDGRTILWGGVGNNGVFSNFVRKNTVDDWKRMMNK